jgi:predicted hotdog family 3-hydroxylacyl-ACP dehydratase
METARAAVRRELDRLTKARDELVRVGATVTGLPDIADPNVADGEFSAALARELARYAVIGWEGVANADGTPAEPSAGNIAMAMQIDAVSRAFTALYLLSLEGLAAEGNGSAPALPGSLGAGANTATDAAPPAASAA